MIRSVVKLVHRMLVVVCVFMCVCVCVRARCTVMVSGLQAIGVPFNDSISTAEVIQRKQEDDGTT
jgi:hypothetical protein